MEVMLCIVRRGWYKPVGESPCPLKVGLAHLIHRFEFFTFKFHAFCGFTSSTIVTSASRVHITISDYVASVAERLFPSLTPISPLFDRPTLEETCNHVQVRRLPQL